MKIEIQGQDAVQTTPSKNLDQCYFKSPKLIHEIVN